ncbi:hypothetical protein [Paenibacillus abyssi]|uniref:Uncharacterized protein n=1 Tax=Paenibacillus abyssi TaxID=1340531 RepID=A0A917LFH7_9BACL|nr:hypothetical protein [Paenibacillus abyssi]GGG18268.1 hypothetical protein GCM10010916_38870 [Paenibacillus abyssi]
MADDRAVFEQARKEKVFVQVVELRNELKGDIDGLEQNLELLESTDQLDDEKQAHINSGSAVRGA